MNGTEAPVEILLVEDTPADAELCIRSLRKHNLANRVLWVKDGAEALDSLYHTGSNAAITNLDNLKVVLLDLRLPKIDGLEVLRRMRSDQRTKSIPIVILTSSKESSDIAKAYSLGANSFVRKPVEFDAFSETVAKLGFYWLLVNKPPPSSEIQK